MPLLPLTYWLRRPRGLVALALISIAVVAIVAVPSTDSAPKPHISVVAGSSNPSQSRSAHPPIEHQVLFIGASYTAGLGAIPATDGYAYVIGREPGWHAQINGVAGTGFLNPGPHSDQSFGQRVAVLPNTVRPDLIVFQCGRNDVGYSATRLRAAVISVTAAARRRFGDAQIVLLGPIPAGLPVAPGLVTVEDTLRSAALAGRASFIDPIAAHWITPQNEHGYLGPVPAHPDDQGYAYIAAKLFADLETLAEQHRTA